MVARALTIDDQENALTVPLLLPVALRRAGQSVSQLIKIDPVPWQTSFGTQPWRVPIHPWTSGLHTDRFHDGTTYAWGPCDVENSSILLSGPQVSAGAAPGGGWGDGVMLKFIEFNGKAYLISGNEVYSYTTGGVTTLVKDFEADYTAAITDAVLFNDEIIFALGESDKVVKMNSSETFAQASDNVFAVNLAVVGDLLWRSHDTNQVDSCATTPLTLANWTSANYPVGDTSFTTTAMVEYGGVLWVLKNDGCYEGDNAGRFKNQVPQLANEPRTAQLLSLFTAFGYLWVGGRHWLYRVQHGESRQVGPDVGYGYGDQFEVVAGLQRGEAVYLIVWSIGYGATLMKMLPEENVDTGGPAGHDYVFYHIADLAQEGVVKALGFFAAPTNPELLIGDNTAFSTVTLGRGARDVTDANYAFDDDFILYSGPFTPSRDMAVTSTLTGVDIVAWVDHATHPTFTVSAGVVEATFSTLTFTTGSLTADAYKTYVFNPTTPPTKGNFFEVKVAHNWDSATAGAGQVWATATRVREVWAYGYMHPGQTDQIEVTCYVGSRMVAPATDLANEQALDTKMAFWKDNGTLLSVIVPGYNNETAIDAILADWEWTPVETILAPGEYVEHNQLLTLKFTRIDYDGSYGS